MICFTNLMINLDHGILPACTAEVREDIGISNLDLGILGSLVYLGQVLGKLKRYTHLCNYRIHICVADLQLRKYQVHLNRVPFP